MGERVVIILFDLDGTLIDSTEAILECFHHTFDVFHYPQPSDEAIKALIGYPLDSMYADLGVEKERVWDFVARYKECYRKISTEKTFLLQNAREAVEQASQFARLGIVTTKTGAYSKILMENFGLMHHFDVLIGREDVEKPKPNAEPILKALEHFAVTDKEVWMIGDTELDLKSAQSAKINAIGVLCGYGSIKNLQHYTEHLSANAYEAVQYLKSRKYSHSN